MCIGLARLSLPACTHVHTHTHTHTHWYVATIVISDGCNVWYVATIVISDGCNVTGAITHTSGARAHRRGTRAPICDAACGCTRLSQTRAMS